MVGGDGWVSCGGYGDPASGGGFARMVGILNDSQGEECSTRFYPLDSPTRKRCTSIDTCSERDMRNRKMCREI